MIGELHHVTELRRQVTGKSRHQLSERELKAEEDLTGSVVDLSRGATRLVLERLVEPAQSDTRLEELPVRHLEWRQRLEQERHRASGHLPVDGLRETECLFERRRVQRYEIERAQTIEQRFASQFISAAQCALFRAREVSLERQNVRLLRRCPLDGCAVYCGHHFVAET